MVIFQPLLPSTLPPFHHLPRFCRGDNIIWSASSNGKFSFKTACWLLMDKSCLCRDGRWKTIWKWGGPQRICFFLWLAYRDQLLTNAERTRRYLVSSSICSICHGKEEFLLHVMRDCHAASSIWQRIVKPDKWSFFTGKGVRAKDWLMFNL